jgi:hypothetical protein
LRHGQTIPAGAGGAAEVRAYAPGGEFVGVLAREAGRWRARRLLRTDEGGAVGSAGK